MKSRPLHLALSALCVSLVSATGGSAQTAHGADAARRPVAGDSRPGDIFRLPERAFHRAGGKVYDIVRDFGAIPNDGKDDTAAFRRAYDLAVGETERRGFKPFSNDGNKAAPSIDSESILIYLPAGTYNLSDTAIYSGDETRVWNFGSFETGRTLQKVAPTDRIDPGAQETLARVRLIGESRERTILVLADHAPGFDDPARPRPVVSFGKHAVNNSVGYNELRNVTIDTGRGNPGAIGVRFGGANSSGIHNVAVRSGDGSGAAGIALDINPAIPLLTDISVSGFDIGIWGKQRQNLPHQIVLDRVTLQDQRVAGARFDGLVASVARLKVERAPIPVQIREGSAHVVLIDSDLGGNARGGPAIALDAGFLLARAVRTSAVGSAIRAGAQTVAAAGDVDEFISDVNGKPAAIQGAANRGGAHTLRLPAPDPAARAGDLSAFPDLTRDWAAPEDFDPLAGTPGHDSTDAVRRAFASGKPVIYFPRTVYYLTGSVKVPASVRSIQFLYSRFVSDSSNPNRGYLEIAERSERPLVIEDYLGGYNAWRLIDQTAWRPIVFRHVTNPVTAYGNQVLDGPPVPLFLESVTGFGKSAAAFRNTVIAARALNTESKTEVNWTIPGGSTMWVLGFKTEGTVPAYRVEAGGNLEVLGGLANQFGHHSSPPRLLYGNCPEAARNIACFGLIQNYGGRTSISLATTRTGPAELIPVIIEDGAPGPAHAIPRSAIPSRPPPAEGGPARFSDIRIPLYVSDPVPPPGK